MYKLLLCWRYLLTRYLALVCIASVMLGVATLIVVNSVMSGFSTKLRERLHGLLSDVVVDSMFQDGFPGPDEKMQQILKDPIIGSRIEAITPTIEVLGLVQMSLNGQSIAPRAVRFIGVEPKSRAAVGGFAEFLADPWNKENPSFDLRPEAREWHDRHYPVWAPGPMPLEVSARGEPPPQQPPQPKVEARVPAGIFVGYSIAHFRRKDAKLESAEKDVAIQKPGDEVVLFTVSGEKMMPVYDRVVIADFFKTEMSEYDSSYVFVPLDWLQRLRSMEDRATSLEIKLKSYADAKEVVNRLQQLFPDKAGYQVATWEDKQGPLLAAISIERGILNILLFMIIGVAGFGILAIFSMIVVEKTRDIGILKALGASSFGVMKIFLGYGLLLGAVGAGLGTLIGIGITKNINGIELFLTKLTGHEIFDRTIYYFNEIPTNVQAWTVALVNAGAILIAVIFSVLPALRAALLHPVRALRYE
jgi:lipoprotein-releasing system permease protein